MVRACNDPIPEHGGDDCAGDSDRSEPCNLGDCVGEWMVFYLSLVVSDFNFLLGRFSD